MNKLKLLGCFIAGVALIGCKSPPPQAAVQPMANPVENGKAINHMPVDVKAYVDSQRNK